MRLFALAASLAALTVAACSAGPLAPEGGTYGPNPTLVRPSSRVLPVVNIAPAVGWPEGQTPTAPQGYVVQAFASSLDHPRWLYRLPNGDVLVAETNAPPKPEDKQGGIRGWVMKLVMGRDGVAETKTAFLENLMSPFGMALVGDRLFVANADAVVAFPYQAGQTRIDAAPTKIADLPAGRNHHWTKSMVASADGTKLYVGVGSNSNIAEHGLDEEVNRAAILEITIATGATRVFASGLRNPVGLAWEPVTGQLWTAVNERDELGNDLVPDYMTSVRDGGFYGWPWSYYGQTVDRRVKPENPEAVARALRPDYALGAHTASLGLHFYDGSLLPAAYRGGAFIGQHGSWNREPKSGYKVVFVPFTAGRPAGPPQDFLTGFLNAEGEALGRPVGVITDQRGALLVADDVGNIIWRVAPAA
jgi:glucose/arabinose dehydrogenase